MTNTHTGSAEAETAMSTTTDGDVIAFDVNEDGTVTVRHTSGIVRTISADHPAAINLASDYPEGWCYGTGKGNPRLDLIMHGHVTAKGNLKRYVCEACDVRQDATKFPTLHRPTADGRTRNTKECRECRDSRYAVGRATGTTPTREAIATAATVATGAARAIAAFTTGVATV